MDWVTLLLKLILVPTFIGTVSLAGRRWGSTVEGWLVGLPYTAGPVALFLALEQGNVFAAEASQAIMIGISSSYIFALIYSRLASRLSWLLTALAGFCGYFAWTYLLNIISLPTLVAFIFVIVALVTSLKLIPRAKSAKSTTRKPRWEIPARMVAATALVLLITGVAETLGPKLTGLFTTFPLYTSVLAIFTHRFEGRDQTVVFLRGLVAGSFTFTTFFLIISTTIVSWGIIPSFLCAIGVSLFTHAAILQFLRRS